jgi:hypothetical protein
MAVRTNATNVKGIIEVDATIIKVDSDLDPFIEVANELVTEQCTGTNGPATAYTATRLELIERWLAAHFYTNRDPRPTNEKAGPVGAAYQSRVDLGFDTSHYGQHAMRLDTNGGLAALNQSVKKGGKQTVGFTWLGTTPPP